MINDSFLVDSSISTAKPFMDLRVLRTSPAGGPIDPELLGTLGPATFFVTLVLSCIAELEGGGSGLNCERRGGELGRGPAIRVRPVAANDLNSIGSFEGPALGLHNPGSILSSDRRLSTRSSPRAGPTSLGAVEGAEGTDVCFIDGLRRAILRSDGGGGMSCQCVESSSGGVSEDEGSTGWGLNIAEV